MFSTSTTEKQQSNQPTGVKHIRDRVSIDLTKAIMLIVVQGSPLMDSCNVILLLATASRCLLSRCFLKHRRAIVPSFYSRN